MGGKRNYINVEMMVLPFVGFHIVFSVTYKQSIAEH